MGKGSWSSKEHAAFLSGMNQYGKGKWAEVAAKIKTRTREQTESYAQKYFGKLEKGAARIKKDAKRDSRTGDRNGWREFHIRLVMSGEEQYEDNDGVDKDEPLEALVPIWKKKGRGGQLVKECARKIQTVDEGARMVRSRKRRQKASRDGHRNKQRKKLVQGAMLDGVGNDDDEDDVDGNDNDEEDYVNDDEKRNPSSKSLEAVVPAMKSFRVSLAAPGANSSRDEAPPIAAATLQVNADAPTFDDDVSHAGYSLEEDGANVARVERVPIPQDKRKTCSAVALASTESQQDDFTSSPSPRQHAGGHILGEVQASTESQDNKPEDGHAQSTRSGHRSSLKTQSPKRAFSRDDAAVVSPVAVPAAAAPKTNNGLSCEDDGCMQDDSEYDSSDDDADFARHKAALARQLQAVDGRAHSSTSTNASPQPPPQANNDEDGYEYDSSNDDADFERYTQADAALAPQLQAVHGRAHSSTSTNSSQRQEALVAVTNQQDSSMVFSTVATASNTSTGRAANSPSASLDLSSDSKDSSDDDYSTTEEKTFHSREKKSKQQGSTDCGLCIGQSCVQSNQDLELPDVGRFAQAKNSDSKDRSDDDYSREKKSKRRGSMDLELPDVGRFAQAKNEGVHGMRQE